jgi:hypothetical protein
MMIQHPIMIQYPVKSAVHQSGAILAISLIVLVILSAAALSAVNIARIDLKIASNVQSQEIVSNNLNQSIEKYISDIAVFNEPAKASDKVGIASIEIAKSECVVSKPSAGYSALSGISPEDTYWKIEATARDSVTGVATAVTQGVKIKMLSGHCL